MNSKELYQKSKEILPGGVSSPVRAYKPYPFYAQSGKGCHIKDVDGNTYIDHCLGYGPLILGHGNEKIQNAIKEQIEKGVLYGVPEEKEIQLAEEIIKRVPSAEMVRFVNTGGEATMAAIRLARGYTKRDKIVKFEGAYHGAHDYTLVKKGETEVSIPDSAGIPEKTSENTLTIPFNDEQALINLLEKEGENIACIIMEVVMGNIGCIKPNKGYLDLIRKLTIDYGIVLIFDEVITGFRLTQGGAQELYGITPDLTTFAKIIGGGLPLAAITGKKEIMELIAPNGPVYQAGTYNGNPLSLSAGLATLEQLDEKFYNEINTNGNYLRAKIQNILEDLNLNYQVAGIGSMFQIYFNPNPVTNSQEAKESDTEKFLEYFREMLKNGVFIPPSQFETCFLSNTHTEEELNKTLYAVEKSLKEIH